MKSHSSPTVFETGGEGQTVIVRLKAILKLPLRGRFVETLSFRMLHAPPIPSPRAPKGPNYWLVFFVCTQNDFLP